MTGNINLSMNQSKVNIGCLFKVNMQTLNFFDKILDPPIFNDISSVNTTI